MAYIGNPPTIGQWRKLDDISGSFNGSTTTFTTSVGGSNVTAGSANQLIVSLGGVIQQPNVDYSVTTNSLIFTTAPASGLDFFAVLAGDALNTAVPADGTITTAKLAGNLTVDLDSGSAAAPSLTFDSNTGLFSPAPDEVSISTGGTERLRIDSAGQISSVSLGTAGAPTFSFTGDTNTGIYSPGADQLALSTNGTGRLFVDASGRVLVGTSTARAAASTTIKPTVQVEDGNYLQYSAIQNTNDASGPAFVFGKTRGTTAGAVTIVQSGDELGTLYFVGADGTDIATTGATITAEVDGTPGVNAMPSRLVFSTTPSASGTPQERLRITSAGLVGIGTSSPTGKLTVTPIGGTFTTNCNDGDYSTYGLYIEDASTSLNAVLGAIGFGGPIRKRAAITCSSEADLDQSAIAFWTQPVTTGSSATLNERMRIDSQGRVGIGTTSPAYLLDVAGDITSSSIIRAGTSILQTNNLTLGASGADAVSAGVRFSMHLPTSTPYPQYFLLSSFSAGRTADPNNLGQGNLNLKIINRDGTTRVEALRVDAEDGTLTVTSRSSTPPLTVNIGSSEVGRFDSSGRLLVGTSSAFLNGFTCYQFDGSTYNGGVYKTTWASTGSDFLVFANSANAVAGSITHNGTTTVNYVTSSDYRLKENITPVADGIARLQQLKPSRFNFIADPDKTVDGFIAHEVQTIVPEAITGEKDAVDEEGNPVYQGIDHSKLVPLLTAALQEAIGEIESLKARVAALESA